MRNGDRVQRVSDKLPGTVIDIGRAFPDDWALVRFDHLPADEANDQWMRVFEIELLPSPQDGSA